MMSDARWSEQQHVDRVELELRSTVTHVREHVMLRRMMALTFYVFGQILPAGPQKTMFQQYGQQPNAAALAELQQQALAFMTVDALAAQARADSALLDTALDFEGWRAQEAALPPPAPTDGTDDPLTPDERATVEQQRSELQAQMAAAAQPTLDLVAQRDAYRTAQNPPPPVIDPQPEEQPQP